MKNNITELCALLWAMHLPESRDNKGLNSEIAELHKLVISKSQTDIIQTKINNILKVYTFLTTPYATCKQAITQQKDNNWLQTLIPVSSEHKRNLPPGHRTPLETEKAKGDEIDNIAVEIELADNLKNCYSPGVEEKSYAQKAIELIKAQLKL